jgi:hypothetical protein
MPDATVFRLDPSAACDACGCFGAYHFESETLCPECCAGRGSCCSTEFSGRTPDGDDDTPASSRESPPVPSDRQNN